MVTEQELQDALDLALNSIICWCGNYKRIDKPFCFQCYDILPINWKLILNRKHKHLVNDPAHTYDAALRWLKNPPPF